ncbi:radical SAM protein [Oceanicoccus sp. KOV_DT_Chl]|uniref:B12-binding domain-containing radical SAM protein n=1 Tax=Oceanicoccus sp. KOV_DT_Chl TaxID=1904639 RepID=UPI001357CFE2|nr:radical SAM protein [Oceanicoccus sp. KOV_DT_Chl]
MDSDQFWAAPATTGGLKSYYRQYGQRWQQTRIELVHFRNDESIAQWQQQWLQQGLAIAQQAIALGQQPVAGFSFYTWNAAEFLALIRFLKQSCPELLIIAGGPHVQQAEDYLFDDPIDLISLGEGEASFQELLDCDGREQWHLIAGLAYLDKDGQLHKTSKRERTISLDELPSALDVMPLTDAQGEPLYESYSYETSRGCPFKCAFCEWGTGAIGGKMYQFSMARIRKDWELIIGAGVKDIWLADSNFGALKEDQAKAELICELKEKTGLPSSFATSWSKKHSPRVQEIALLLNRNGLLPHYQLALQTLTPKALELSNRKNMASNKYEPIAKEMAKAGVPIAAELIWGLPGDNLKDYERNLDSLLATFPNINIFGYTLLPGTEFYEKRAEYQIDAIPVAGYGKAKGEYVVGCHTFDRNEGIEGYFLISAHIILNHGHVMPLTVRYLALEGSVPVSPLLRSILRALIKGFEDQLVDFDLSDRMEVYEHRAPLYLAMLRQPAHCFSIIEATIFDWLSSHQASAPLIDAVSKTLQLDHAFCPRYGARQFYDIEVDFDGKAISQTLNEMDLPNKKMFSQPRHTLNITSPGGVGDFMKDPDGGSWVKGEFVEEQAIKLDEVVPVQIP